MKWRYGPNPLSLGHLSPSQQVRCNSVAVIRQLSDTAQCQGNCNIVAVVRQLPRCHLGRAVAAVLPSSESYLIYVPPWQGSCSRVAGVRQSSPLPATAKGLVATWLSISISYPYIRLHHKMAHTPTLPAALDPLKRERHVGLLRDTIARLSNDDARTKEYENILRYYSNGPRPQFPEGIVLVWSIKGKVGHGGISEYLKQSSESNDLGVLDIHARSFGEHFVPDEFNLQACGAGAKDRRPNTAHRSPGRLVHYRRR